MLQILSKFWVWNINSLENSIVQGSCFITCDCVLSPGFLKLMFYDKWKVKIFLRSHCYDKPLEHEWIVLVGLTLVKMIWKRLFEDITCFSLQISMVFRSYSLYAIWLTYILQKCKCSQTLLLSWTLWGLWEHLQHLRSWGKKSKRRSCWDFKMTLTYPWYLRYIVLVIKKLKFICLFLFSMSKSM